jgi:hypothetical protein
MKAISKINLIIIFIVIFFHIGTVTSYSQESTFIITLKNGAEISTQQYLVEDKILYYRFQGYKRAVGINMNAVSKITEQISSFDLRDFEISANTYGQSKLVKESDVKKVLQENGYEPTREAAKEPYQPMYAMGDPRKYLDVKNGEYFIVVEGNILKIRNFPEITTYPIYAIFKNENDQIILTKEVLPLNTLKSMKQDSLEGIKEAISINRKARNVSIETKAQ